MSVLKGLVKKLEDEDVTELMLRPDLVVIEDKWCGPIAYIVWPVSNGDGYMSREQAVMLMKQYLHSLAQQIDEFEDFDEPGLTVHVKRNKAFTEITWFEGKQRHKLDHEVVNL